MSYYEDVFKKRVGYYGNTKKDIITNVAERQFLVNLRDSPNAEDIFVDGEATRAIILTNKIDQSKLSMLLYTKRSDDVGPGAIVSWGIEKWLVVATDKFSIPAYVKHIMFRTNTVVSYIEDGAPIVQMPALFSGTLDKILRESIYRQMGLAIPLEDRTAMLITSKKTFKKETRLLIDGRAWVVVDYDNSTNKNMAYHSLVEDKIDLARDNVELGVADALVMPQWEITMPDSALTLEVGQSYYVAPVITKDGIVQADLEPIITVTKGAGYVTYAANTLTGSAVGVGEVTCAIAKYPTITRKIPFTIVASNSGAPMTAYTIDGDEVIRWGGTKNYQLKVLVDGVATPESASFTIEGLDGAPTSLAEVSVVNASTCMVAANKKNLVGEIVLKAVSANGTYTKNITIRSLW